MDDDLAQFPEWLLLLMPLVAEKKNGEPVARRSARPTSEQEKQADRWLLSWFDGEAEPLTDELRETILPRARAAALFLRSAKLYGNQPPTLHDMTAARALLIDSRQELREVLDRVDQEQN